MAGATGALAADDPPVGKAPGWYGTNMPPPPIIGPSPYLPDGRTVGESGAPIPCLCRANDRSYKVGEVVCLSTPRGLLKASCQRVENITSWIIADEPCTTM